MPPIKRNPSTCALPGESEPCRRSTPSGAPSRAMTRGAMPATTIHATTVPAPGPATARAGGPPGLLPDATRAPVAARAVREPARAAGRANARIPAPTTAGRPPRETRRRTGRQAPGRAPRWATGPAARRATGRARTARPTGQGRQTRQARPHAVPGQVRRCPARGDVRRPRIPVLHPARREAGAGTAGSRPQPRGGCVHPQGQARARGGPHRGTVPRGAGALHLCRTARPGPAVRVRPGHRAGRTSHGAARRVHCRTGHGRTPGRRRSFRR